MELTLLLPSADAARLRRLPVIKAALSGRARGQAVRIVWHDSLDRALASEGLALAEQRGRWRLERHRPEPTDPWPPATGHRLIEEANGLPALRQALTEADALPEVITPVAAFEGRRTVFPLTIDGEAVSITLLDGVLRAVAAERPAARLILEGPGPVVRPWLLSLAEALPLSVPEQSLAAEALHLAGGTAPAPRRHGAPALPRMAGRSRPPFNHIIGHLTDVMLHLAPIGRRRRHRSRTGASMRVAVRRARSAMSVFQAVPDSPDLTPGLIPGGLKAETVRSDARAGAGLGRVHDRDRAAGRGGAAGTNRPARFAAQRRAAAARGAGGVEHLPRRGGIPPDLPGTGLSGRRGTAAVRGRRRPPLPEFAAGVLRSRWKKLLQVGKSLEDLDNPGLHGLRLKAKRLRYAAEFFAPLFAEKPASRFIRRLAALQERLGLFNDTAVADALLRELNGKPGYAAGLVLGFTAARGAGIRPQIARSWARFRRRDPFWEPG